MAPTKTRTVKNKHAGTKSGGDSGKGGGKGGGAKRSATDGISKSRGGKQPKAPATSQQVKQKNKATKKTKRKIYTEEELGIPKLNMITPVGVVQPKSGKKKGKVFVDDRESMTTIMSLVQAEKDGQIESKMIKARQLEEIREARKVEAEKKEGERRSKIEDTKDSLRKKRKRKSLDDDDGVKKLAAAGTKPLKQKKRVSFA